MELNAETIKKALECCGEYTHGTTCNNCPYMHIDLADNDICSNRMSRDALALITSQEQRMKELTAENKLLNVELGNANSEILRLIERTKELTEENERLKSVEFTCGFVKPHKVLECPIFDEIVRTKADTVREMQDRIAQYIGTYTDKSFVYVSAMFKLIDRVAKEMLEGNNEV